MKKTLLLALLSGFSFCQLFAYTGRVFVDTNKNGIYDKGEKTLEGISVSDGLNVVKTDANGMFNLPGHSRERFIFITTPSGYKTDNSYYKAIESDIVSYDFGLYVWNDRINNDGSHRFVHISDTEIFNTTNNELWANNIRDYAANEKMTFIMHTGDLCYEKGLKEHIQLMNSSNMDCPVFYSIGNHDLVKGKYGEELFENIYGPVYYSFDFGNTHYIVTPMANGDHKPGYTKEDVYRWLKNDLAHVSKDKSVIVFNHDLLTSDDKFIFGINDTEYINLNNYNLKAWLYGHWHNNFARWQGSVQTICTSSLDKGGIDHSTTAYRVLSVNSKGEVQSELRYTYIDKSIRINSIGNNWATKTADGKIPLSVNVYSSVSPVKNVQYNCIIDNKQFVSNTTLTQNTDWNWSGFLELPDTYKNKQIFVEAKAIFNNGEVAIARESFIFTPDNKKQIKPHQDWLTLLRDASHIGISADTLAFPVKLNWITNIKANIYFSSPVIYNNRVYVASVDEDLKGDGGIYALNATDGALIWKYKTRNSVKNTIACEDGIVFAQDAEGYLYAIDGITGKLRWEKKLNINGLPALIDGLTTKEEVVYAGTGKGFAAYKTNTGEMIWQNKDWVQGEGTTSTVSVSNNVVISGAQWRGLYGNDATTGKLVWSLSNYGLSDRGATAAIHGGLLYVTSRQSLFIIDIQNGTIILRKELPFALQVASTPLVTDKLIIFGTVTDGLIALNKETLDIKWKVATSPALIYTSPYTRYPASTIETSPVLAGNTIFFGASDGILYGVDINNGNVKWKHETGAPIFSSVAISGNTMFVSDFGGNVYAFTGSN